MKEKYTPGMFTSQEIIWQYLMSFDVAKEVIPVEASEEISTFYEKMENESIERLETYNKEQKPIHPESGEEANFIGYLTKYPVYKTASGLYLMRKRNEYFPISPTSPNAEVDLRSR